MRASRGGIEVLYHFDCLIGFIDVGLSSKSGRT